jgi:hypothetical protein
MTGCELAELRSLLDALCEEAITAEQVKRLEALVLAYPAAEAYYVQYMSLFAGLCRHFAGVASPTQQSLLNHLEAAPTKAVVPGPGCPRPVSPWYRRRRVLAWGSLALTGVAAGLLLMVALAKPPHHLPLLAHPDERVDNTIAVLLQAPGAEWEKSNLPTRVGSPLPPGLLRLKSGFAHLEFYSGATVILEGPAEFQLISPTQAYCTRGKLRATVPPQAQGFTIGSPMLDLIDRGTEFCLEVGAADRTEVHVVSGKVELYEPGADRNTAKELTTGQSVRLEGVGDTRPIKPNPAGFRTARELAAQSQEETRRRWASWQSASAGWRLDPTLEIYYVFQNGQAWDRTLQDQSRQRKQPHDGAIVGCSWVTGRWSGRTALEFKQVSDRVRFQLPGDFDSITLLAWVRVDALPNMNNSLMMADGWPQGSLHWQIGNDGKLILGVQSHPKGHGAHYHAHGAITPEHFGQWLHLGVVYDREQGQVLHYLNGRAIAQEPTLFDIPLHIGDAELGNWNIASHRNNSPVRYLTGCMDEFMLFSRALSEAEIERLYTQSRPPS